MDCPYLNSQNPKCSAHLNMHALGDAFELCTDRYKLCPLYLQLSGELKQPSAALSAPCAATAALSGPE